MLNRHDYPAARCVYAIRHVPSGRRYIGGTKDLRFRLKEHLGALRSGRHMCALLQQLWNEAGEDAFAVDIVYLVPPDENLVLAERRWLVDDGLLLNATWEQHHRSLSEAKQGERHNYYGTRRPDSTRRKLSAGKAGDLNPMFGVMEGDHPRARAIVIDGERFPAIVAAARRLNRSLSTINYWLRNGRAEYVD